MDLGWVGRLKHSSRVSKVLLKLRITADQACLDLRETIVKKELLKIMQGLQAITL